ncbi:MAG: DUF4352 domain-containing protein [Bryobacteraceae bacterium]
MKVLRSPKLLTLLCLFLAGCEQQQRTNLNYGMGERVEIGPFTYVVVENSWRSELGEGFQTRAPKNRFLVLSISVTNGGGSDVSVPMLSVEGSNGQMYQELSDGSGIANWLGILRTAKPAETLQGRVLFDAPLGAYRLRLPDGGESGYEKYSWVTVPLSLDATDVQAPLPGGAIK